MQTTPIAPTIHLNGTGGQYLLHRLLDAMTAIHAAIAAVQKTAPHGRDYYVQNDHAINKAMDEHRDRLVRLEAVRTELDAIAANVLDQIDARQTARNR
jgi:hypothetical protein